MTRDWPMHIAFFRYAASATLIAMVLATGGCATISSVDHPTSLIGASVNDAERAWGKPYFAYQDPDGGAQRLVYQFREDELKFDFAIILVPCTYSRLHCFRLTVNDSGFVTDYETPSLLSSPYATACLQKFFGNDTADALFVAREYRKPSPLKWRARRGDAVAATVLADEFGETYYLIKRPRAATWTPLSHGTSETKPARTISDGLCRSSAKQPAATTVALSCELLSS